MVPPKLSVLLAAVLTCLCLATAAEARKIALIVGNDTYAHLPPLQKAVADSGGYAELFGKMDFEVSLVNDVDTRAMSDALDTFYEAIAPGDTVLFAYSGHGWSNGRENFLLPTDIPGTGTVDSFTEESFKVRNGVDGIIDKIVARGPRLTVAIIDACRDNPFTLPPELVAGGQILKQGLVEVTAPSGTFIAFSAGAGQSALDRISDSDPVRFSVFTRYFLHELSKPQDLQAAFKATQRLVSDTAKAIGYQQLPASYDEVVGSACLSGECGGPVSPMAPSDPADPIAVAAAEWQDFKNSTSIAALTAFAERHAGTPYADLARERIAMLEAQAADPGTAGERKSPVAENPRGRPKVDEVAAADPPKKIVVPLPRTPPAEPPQAPPAEPPQAPPQVPPPQEPPQQPPVVPDDPFAPPAQPGAADDPFAPGPGGGDRSDAYQPSPGAGGGFERPGWCGQAFTAAEQAVCADAGLSSRDMKMQVFYDKLWDKLKPGPRRDLQASQETWLAERELCGGDAVCLSTSYDRRIVALMQY